MITRLIEVCQRVGHRVPYWTQGGGGNISVKHDDSLWIKASGMRLSEVTSPSALARVRIEEFRSQMSERVRTEDEYAKAVVENGDISYGRPSMETGFHALLDAPWVLHFHSLPALLMAYESMKDDSRFSAWMEKQTNESFSVLPPIMPGLELSHKIASTKDLCILILANHGVVLQGSDPDQTLDHWSELESKFCLEWGYSGLDSEADLERSDPLKIYFPDSAVFLDRMRSSRWREDRDARELWMATKMLFRACPDLSEVPEPIASRVAGLPTEQFRRKASNP